MLVVLVFVVQVKAQTDSASTNRTLPPPSLPAASEAPLNGAETPDTPVVVMQHEDIERLLESMP